MSRKIGMWLYSNSGGDKISKKIIKKETGEWVPLCARNNEV